MVCVDRERECVRVSEYVYVCVQDAKRMEEKVWKGDINRIETGVLVMHRLPFSQTRTHTHTHISLIGTC